MKYSFALAAASAAVVNADCGLKSFNEGGNWFCQAVEHIKYTGLDVAGSYKAVTAMHDDGTCSFSDIPYTGPIAPLDEEVSIHLRGPAKLKQVAVYTKSSSSKRAVEPHAKRHGHQHLHHKRRAHVDEAKQEEKRADIVTATIDGKVVTWVNNWFGPNAAPATPAAAPAATKAAAAAVAPAPAVASPSAAKASAKPSTGSSGSTTGDYSRAAYYNSEKQIADGLVFLGMYGDKALSGTWDYTWGGSLSYLNTAGTAGAASAEVLADTQIPSNKEFVIMADKECNGDCGFVRPGTVAYHGFGGADRVMLFEFQMPYDGDRGFNGDMPALWLLNARIPRTLQYGSCSCWDTGCGEMDIFEVLASGDSKCKSTLHTNTPGGSSDYFDRPATKPVKVAVVTQSDSSSMSIKVLDDSFDFSTSLTQAQVDDLVDDTKSDKGLFSLFAVVA